MITSSQKIIAIDDQFNEVLPLLQALWKKRMPCLYLDGAYDSLPKEPFTGVRLLFLDIEIETKGNNEANMASALAARVESVIGKTPCPYFIVFWTKNTDQIEKVIAYLTKANIAPIGFLDFEKPMGTTSEDLVEELFKKIENKLENLGSFNYLLDWESKIDESASKFSNDFFSLINSSGDAKQWSEDASSILANLACAHTGSDALSEICADNIKNAFLLLGESFKDSLDTNIKNSIIVRDLLVKKPLGLSYLSQMNKALFFDFYPEQTPSIGNVFIENGVMKNEYLIGLQNDIFKDRAAPECSEVIGMIITPSCDLAAKKSIMYNESENVGHYRVLHGLQVPFSTETYKFLKNLKSPAFVLIQPFKYPHKDESYIMIFHFGALTSKWITTKSKVVELVPGHDIHNSITEEIPEVKLPQAMCVVEVLHFTFRLKELLVFDIQSKMASHANRLGNTMLGL